MEVSLKHFRWGSVLIIVFVATPQSCGYTKTSYTMLKCFMDILVHTSRRTQQNISIVNMQHAAHTYIMYHKYCTEVVQYLTAVFVE